MQALIQHLKSWPWNKIITLTLICVGAVVLAIWGKKIIWGTQPINTAPQVTQEAPQAAKIDKVRIKTEYIYIYPKEELVRKIPQAPELVNNPRVQFTATAEIPRSPYGGVATAYTNISTGKAGIGYTAKSHPFIEWGGSGGIGIKGGVGAGTGGTGYTGGLFVRQKLITVAGKPISAVGELNASTYGKPEVKAVIEADLWSWQ